MKLKFLELESFEEKRSGVLSAEQKALVVPLLRSYLGRRAKKLASREKLYYFKAPSDSLYVYDPHNLEDAREREKVVLSADIFFSDVKRTLEISTKGEILPFLEGIKDVFGSATLHYILEKNSLPEDVLRHLPPIQEGDKDVYAFLDLIENDGVKLFNFIETKTPGASPELQKLFELVKFVVIKDKYMLLAHFDEFGLLRWVGRKRWMRNNFPRFLFSKEDILAWLDEASRLEIDD